MTIDELRSEIIEKVSSVQGCKLTELVLLLSKEVIIEFDADKILSTVNEIVSSGELTAVEYILPSMPYRVKTFILPKCENIKIVTE